MFRGGRLPIPPLTPQLERILLIGLVVIAAVIAAALLFELVLTRSAALYLRLTGHRPPRKTRLAEDLDRLQKELTNRR